MKDKNLKGFLQKSLGEEVQPKRLEETIKLCTEIVREQEGEKHFHYDLCRQLKGGGMEMIRRKVFLGISVALMLGVIIASGSYLYKKANVQTPGRIDIGLDAKTDLYTDTTELKEKADVIIRAKKTGQQEPVITYSENVAVSGYTLSDFQVLEVIKSDQEDIKTGSTLEILENEFYDEKNNIEYHVAGYSMMEYDTEYILYLRANTFENGSSYYTPLGVNFGVVSLGEDYEMNNYQNELGENVSSNKEINNIRKAVREKYKKKK